MHLAMPSAAILNGELPAVRRALRVAVVTETYPPEVNGVACTIAQVVRGLGERGHELQLVRPRQPAADPMPGGALKHESPPAHAPLQQTRFDEVLLRGLPIPRYPHLKMGLPARRTLLQRWRWQRPDVVHIATEGPLGWSALQAAHSLQLPVTSDFRTNFHAYSRHYGIGWLRKPIMAYLRNFHNATQATMVPTEALRRDLADSGFRQLQVVGRGVDTVQFSPARRSDALRAHWGVGPQTQVVACVGRLAPEKNLDVLLAAYAAVREAQPDSRLLLVGDGPARAALQARCPDALFAGLRHGDDLAAHYASADLFVFASTTETYGNVTPEAMASGLPVLAFDYAAAAHLVRSGENGLLAPFDDAAAFVTLARRLAADRAGAQAMGRQARDTALGQGWDRIVGQVEGILRQAHRHGLGQPAAGWLPAQPRTR